MPKSFFLDRFVARSKGSLDIMRREVATAGNRELARKLLVSSDWAAMRAMIVHYEELVAQLARTNTILAAILQDTVTCNEVCPFFYTNEDKVKRGLPPFWMPTAYAPDPDLVAAFAGTNIGPEITWAARQQIRVRRLVYIDLPEGCLKDAGGVELRAAFAEFREDQIQYTAIMAKHGSSDLSRKVWIDYLDKAESHTQPVASGCSPDDSSAKVRKHIEDFVSLIIMYAVTEPTAIDEPLETTATENERNQSRKPSKTKSSSMFSVQRLSHVRRLARHSNDERSSSGITIGVQCVVRGHFRLQACGPRYSARRIIWIAPHLRGPENARIVTPLVKISGPANDQGQGGVSHLLSRRISGE